MPKLSDAEQRHVRLHQSMRHLLFQDELDNTMWKTTVAASSMLA